VDEPCEWLYIFMTWDFLDEVASLVSGVLGLMIPWAEMSTTNSCIQRDISQSLNIRAQLEKFPINRKSTSALSEKYSRMSFEGSRSSNLKGTPSSNAVQFSTRTLPHIVAHRSLAGSHHRLGKFWEASQLGNFFATLPRTRQPRQLRLRFPALRRLQLRQGPSGRGLDKPRWGSIPP
jgi:hypothetical protein